MKKLYQNIEDINIKGGVDQLSEMVSAMDVSLQRIADDTDKVLNFLAKYSSSNKGQQYEKVVTTALRLRDELFDASLELNDMQNQIVEYQNKIYRYEDMSANAKQPNKYMITKRNVSVETDAVQFRLNEMIQVAAALNAYNDQVYHSIKEINSKKNAIAMFWMDSQYKDFSDFIDSITRSIVDGLRVFDEYVKVLEEKIKELS